MSIKAFKKFNSTNRELNKIQDNIEQFASPIINAEIIDGIIVKEVNLLSASTVEVEHKLGRKPLGWQIIRQRASALIWDDQDNNNRPDRTLALKCSANVTVDIRIF